MLGQYSQYNCWPGWIYGAFTGSPFQEGWLGQGVRERFQALAVERNVLFVHAGLLPIFKEGLLVGKVAIKLGTQSYPEVNGHWKYWNGTHILLGDFPANHVAGVSKWSNLWLIWLTTFRIICPQQLGGISQDMLPGGLDSVNAEVKRLLRLGGTGPPCWLGPRWGKSQCEMAMACYGTAKSRLRTRSSTKLL